MKLISLNTAFFEKNNHKLKHFIKSQNADILCLQEVTKRVDNNTDPDFISIDTINEASPDLSNDFFAPTWLLSYFKKTDFHGEKQFLFDLKGKVEFGNYIKTKYKIIKGQNVFVQGNFTYITDWSNWPEEDYRAVQVVDVDIGGKKLRLLNYHGIWSKDKRGTIKTLKACQQIKALALEVDHPSIITGDFNLFPDTESITLFGPEFISLVDRYKVNTTRPATNELSSQTRNVVDYVFVSHAIKVNKFEVLKSDVSDHLPLVLVFEF